MYDINGNLIRMAREQQFLSREDLAHHVCLSHRHIEQLEDGCSKIFFNERHRYQVALKVVKALNLDPDTIIQEIVSDFPKSSPDCASHADPLHQFLKTDLAVIQPKAKKRFQYRRYHNYVIGLIVMAFALGVTYWCMSLFQYQILSEISLAHPHL